MPLSLLVAAWTNYMERISADFCAERKPQAKIVTHCAVRRLSSGFGIRFCRCCGRRGSRRFLWHAVRRRRELPGMRPRPRLEISHRRISAAQKMAFLPRRKSSTSPPPPRRSQNLRRNHPPHRRANSFGKGIERELSGCKGNGIESSLLEGNHETLFILLP